MTGSNRERLDIALTQRGLAASRARARDAILRGCVTVDGRIVDRPSARIADSQDIQIDDPASTYVSRAALKLIAGLDRFGYTPAGLHALDLGASTGGFTQVLLERGAEHITAIDVGHGQIDPGLANDPRVTAIENLNARDLTRTHLPDVAGEVGAVVADLSFISLKLALPAALDLAAPSAWGVFLFKPQFEVGRAAIGKGGIVDDADAAALALTAAVTWLQREQRWSVDGTAPSPIAGSDGNREVLIGARKA